MNSRILSFGVVAVLAVLAVFAVGAGGSSPTIGAAPAGMDASAFTSQGAALPMSEPWDAF